MSDESGDINRLVACFVAPAFIKCEISRGIHGRHVHDEKTIYESISIYS
jgi:hypothetical protein